MLKNKAHTLNKEYFYYLCTYKNSWTLQAESLEMHQQIIQILEVTNFPLLARSNMEKYETFI